MALQPAESPGFLLWHAALPWQRAVTAALARLDLTHVQFVLLACAWWAGRQGDPPNQLALATQAGTDVKMTSAVLAALERKGLIQRDTDPHDTRAKRVTVTARGAEPAPRAAAAVDQVDAEFFRPVRPPDALPLLHRLTHRRAPSTV